MGKVRNWMATVFPESAADAEPVAFRPTNFSHGDRIANFAFEGGKMLSLPLPDTHDPVTKRALRGLRAAQEADALAHRINHDDNLSPIGKQRKLARELAGPLGDVLKHSQALAQRRTALKGRIESAYAIGVPTDGERAEDAEIRQAIRALPEAERRAMLAELVGGKRPQVARALLRSPVPVPGFTESVLEQAWRAGVDATNPEVAEAKEIDNELAEAERTIRRAADIALGSIGPDMLRGALKAQGVEEPGPFNVKMTHGFQPDKPEPPASPQAAPADSGQPFPLATVTNIEQARAK
jgi:hypothetical protein